MSIRYKLHRPGSAGGQEFTAIGANMTFYGHLLETGCTVLVNLAITMDSVSYHIIVITRVAIGRGFRLILTKPTIKSILNPSFGYPYAQLLL